MASQQIELLVPFGEQDERWFRTAYKWKRDEIYAWMLRIAQADHGRPGEILEAIHDYITSLSLPKGALLDDVRTQPRSHIARLLNRYFQQGDGTSRFIVSGWPIVTSIDPSMMEEDPEPRWWCPYDLLGLFLSILGPAPDGANKDNFYLPLTAVYARWCSRIAGWPFSKWGWKIPDSEKGEGHFPPVFQCTWHTTVNDETKQRRGQYFLGATTAGDAFNEESTGSWREKVQEARFNMLLTCQKVTMVWPNDFIKKTAPNQNDRNPNRAGVPWGNCAETYPFAKIFSGDQTKNASMAGLAIRRDFMSEGEYPEYNPSTKKFQNALLGPCPNCSELISRAGGTCSNFL